MATPVESIREESPRSPHNSHSLNLAAALLLEAEATSHEIFLLPVNECAPAAARRRIGAAEGPASEGEALLDALRLVASELVSNAVEHSDPAPGGALFLALVHAPGQVLLAVTDPGSNGGTTPHLRRTDWDAEGGRGLHLVDRCSAYWGVVVAPGATTVWARLSS
ncbi:ATP-binding protein [Nocardiopsis composta]|uniref:ATP-binding protein n=1 Tax=Nocardiopsis composta TaxID=157465 RepID=UPI0031D289E1